MQPSFNINRPPVSDEEIEKRKDFDSLVAQFKKQSLKKARGDESWWKNLPGGKAGKKVQYSTIILGLTVVCTITYQSLKKNPGSLKTTHDKINTSSTTNTTAPKKSSSPTRYVQANVKTLDKKSTVYRVNNQRGADLKHPSSTKITIPKNTFVDREGKEIVGDISIEYREFENLADIVGSGVPMRHDSAGKVYQLESAGMFEIKGHVDGQPVFVNPSRPITIELASSSSENRFHQYYLDTVARNWRYTGPDHIKPAAVSTDNTALLASNQKALVTLEHQVNVELPRKTDSVSTRYEAMLNKSKLPPPPSAPKKHIPGRPTFNFEGSLDDFPELRAFRNVLFEAGPENKNYSQEIHDITWSGIKVSEGPVKGKNYLLNLSNRDRKEQLIIYPVVSEENYDEAMEVHQERLAEYNRLVEKKETKEKAILAEYRSRQAQLAQELSQKEAELERVRASIRETRQNTKKAEAQFSSLSSTAKAARLFQVARFGIYNSDCPHAMASAEVIVPGFVDSENGIIKPEAVYLVDHTLKTVVTSNASNPGLTVLPGNAYSICVMQRGKIYTCDQNAFSATRREKKNTFRVEHQLVAGESLEELRKAIGI